MLNPGLTGAKRQSWEKYNPRDVLRDTMRNKPGATEAEIRDTVWEIIKNEKRYLPVIFDYWFANNYRRFFVEEVEQYSTAIMEIKQNRKSTGTNNPSRDEIDAVKQKVRPVLMDLMLSNNKQLKTATFGECAQEGGWFREIAKQGRPMEIVGKKLTENDLWNLKKRITK